MTYQIELCESENASLSFASDIWALGVTFYILLTNSAPLDPEYAQGYASMIPNHVTNACKNIILSCLQV
jgi:serine/threonine protein kinase